MVLGWSPFRIVSDNPPCQPRLLPWLKIENLAKNHLKIIFSETAGPIGPKLWWNGLQMIFFEKCVRRPRPPPKIAAVTKNRKFGKKSLKNYLLKLLGLLSPNYGGMVFRWSSFRILSDNSAKKSLKNYLLWNCWANWAQTMVEWSSLRIVSDDPGRQPR